MGGDAAHVFAGTSAVRSPLVARSFSVGALILLVASLGLVAPAFSSGPTSPQEGADGNVVITDGRWVDPAGRWFLVALVAFGAVGVVAAWRESTPALLAIALGTVVAGVAQIDFPAVFHIVSGYAAPPIPLLVLAAGGFALVAGAFAWRRGEPTA